MKSWSDTLRLPQPVFQVRLERVLPAAQAGQILLEEQVRAAHEQGRIEGEQALGAQLVQQRAEVRELLDGVVKSLQGAVPQILRDSEQMMVRLAIEIAQKIVAEMPISAEMVETAVNEALSQVEGSAEIIVRLHPADLELLQSVHSELLSSSAEPHQMVFQSSPDVTRGGCLVQTRFGVIDSRRETKIDLLKRALLT